MSEPDANRLVHLNDVRERPDWYLGLIVRGENEWEIPLYRHADRVMFVFTMPPPYSMAEVHAEARRQIEKWENDESEPAGG